MTSFVTTLSSSSQRAKLEFSDQQTFVIKMIFSEFKSCQLQTTHTARYRTAANRLIDCYLLFHNYVE